VRELVKNTDKDDGDFEELKLLLENLHQFIEKINSRKGKTDKFFEASKGIQKFQNHDWKKGHFKICDFCSMDMSWKVYQKGFKCRLCGVHADPVCAHAHSEYKECPGLKETETNKEKK